MASASISAGLRHEDAAEGKIVSVLADRDTLKLAMERTGIEDPAKLVDFSLRLLTEPDPSAEFAREMRGSLSGFDLDV